MRTTRRSFIAGLAAALAAPAIVRTPGLLMPVSPPPRLYPATDWPPIWTYGPNGFSSPYDLDETGCFWIEARRFGYPRDLHAVRDDAFPLRAPEPAAGNEVAWAGMVRLPTVLRPGELVRVEYKTPPRRRLS